MHAGTLPSHHRLYLVVYFSPSLQLLCKHVILETAVFGAFLPNSGSTVVTLHIVTQMTTWGRHFYD